MYVCQCNYVGTHGYDYKNTYSVLMLCFIWPDDMLLTSHVKYEDLFVFMLADELT